jgi:hypothetical protein
VLSGADYFFGLTRGASGAPEPDGGHKPAAAGVDGPGSGGGVEPGPPAQMGR